MKIKVVAEVKPSEANANYCSSRCKWNLTGYRGECELFKNDREASEDGLWHRLPECLAAEVVEELQ